MIINENGVDREMTEAEIAAHQQSIADALAEQTQREQIATEALDARKAPLRRLGLTDDEINIVLGF